VQYKQVNIETMVTMMASGGEKPPRGHNARALYGEFEPKPEGQGDSFAIQHLREVAIDHQNGIFAGTNDLIEKIGGRPPTTLEEFINKHRAAFTASSFFADFIDDQSNISPQKAKTMSSRSITSTK